MFPCFLVRLVNSYCIHDVVDSCRHSGFCYVPHNNVEVFVVAAVWFGLVWFPWKTLKLLEDHLGLGLCFSRVNLFLLLLLLLVCLLST